ncbi:flagellar protein FlaG [Vreelandella sp. EE22]
MDSLPLDNTFTPLTTSASQAFSPQALRQEIVERIARAPESMGVGTVEMSREALAGPVERINEVLRPRGLEFDVSDESSRIITRVIDRETNEVIRQIPGEEVLELARRIEETQGGLISLEA